ncbi:hypothetical protein ABPG72_021147 [Tetrahymena utriculariae]
MIKNLIKYLLQQKQKKMMQQISKFYKLEKFISSQLHNEQTNLELLFNNNEFGDEGISLIASQLKKLQNLNILTINLSGIQKQITDENLQSLANCLGSHNNLVSLKVGLDENHIEEDALFKIGKQLGNCQNLYDLNISLNGCQNVSNQGVSYLIQGLLNCNKITSLTLGLRYNQIGQEGASDIGTGLQTLLNLTTLRIDLSQNQILEQGAVDLTYGLGYCLNLTHLGLNFEEENNISDIGAFSIGAALRN